MPLAPLTQQSPPPLSTNLQMPPATPTPQANPGDTYDPAPFNLEQMQRIPAVIDFVP